MLHTRLATEGKWAHQSVGRPTEEQAHGLRTVVRRRGRAESYGPGDPRISARGKCKTRKGGRRHALHDPRSSDREHSERAGRRAISKQGKGRGRAARKGSAVLSRCVRRGARAWGLSRSLPDTTSGKERAGHRPGPCVLYRVPAREEQVAPRRDCSLSLFSTRIR